MTQNKANKVVDSLIKPVTRYECSNEVVYPDLLLAVKEELEIQKFKLGEELQEEANILLINEELTYFVNNICKIKYVIDTYEPRLTALTKKIGELTRDKEE